MNLRTSEYFPYEELRLLNGFRPILLEEMDGVKLMTRTDAKYVCRLSQLSHLLEIAQPDFQVLEIQGTRLQGYESLYLDTPDHQMYLNHHNGKLNRYKIRIREYLVSGQCFLEIKKKSNTRKTEKKRILISSDRNFLKPEYKSFIASNSPYDPGTLIPAVTSSFIRITLVNKTFFERVTIDIQPAWQAGERKSAFPNLVIIEVKSSHTTNCAGFGFLLREERIQPQRLSKYCTGTALLYPEIKQNRFKEKLLYIQTLEKNLTYHEPIYEPV